MSPEPLPTSLDVRKAAARGSVVSGAVELAKLPRLLDVLASGEGEIEAQCSFSRDEESRSLVTVEGSAKLVITCQRCLEPMPLAIASENTLAIVGSDEAASQLPAPLDPWIVEEEQGALWSLVEDELILEIPVVAYHDTDDCKKLLDAYRQPPETPESDGDNPFKVLEQLKSGTQQQEN